ncbi:MAG: hypothetical protein VW802_13045 [Rhodospirillaceae bacterium]|jgi:hypothetical protein
MKFNFSVLMLALLIATVHGASTPGKAAPRCPGAFEPAQLTVTPNFGTIRYRTGNTRLDLQRMASRHAGRALPGNWYPLGMTQTETIIRAQAEFIIQPLQSGGACAYPSSVTVEVGYQEFSIWIDRRYRQGSCEYQAILDHEHDHVNIYRNQLRLHIDDIHRRVAQVIRRQRPVYAASNEIAVERAKRQLFSRILPLSRGLQRAADRANHKIDTPSSYQAIHDLCRNW